MIEAVIDVRSDDGCYTRDRYQLITTPLDHHRHPAEALVRLGSTTNGGRSSRPYALRHTMLDQVVLRSHDRAGLEQQTWALLTLYQLRRMAVIDASGPGRV